MKKIIFGLASLFIANQSNASVEVYLDNSHKEVVLKAHLVYYGETVDPNIVKSATQEIQTFWSGMTIKPEDEKLNLTAVVKGEVYHLRAEITDEIVTPDVAKTMVAQNTSAAVNFIQIRKSTGNPNERSLYKYCKNTGVFFYDLDDIGKSTTAAHEFGHGMGLDHPDVDDWSGRGRPSIMLPRGVLVDAQYQWDPNAQSGDSGGTLSPYWRRVTQFDVDNLHIENLEFVDGKATLGGTSNELVDLT